MSRYKYVILGSGRQGTSAAYDLAKWGDAHQIILADIDLNAANNAANRINLLTNQDIAIGERVDVTDTAALRKVISDADVVLSSVPYYYNMTITQAAIQSGVHYCDMGGHTGIVRQQLDLDSQARQTGVSVVPDCGMGPGLINTMASYVVDLYDQASEIYIYDGGLPQKPVPPWNYQLTFHINGLTNEMDGQAVFIRNGKLTMVDTLTEPEYIDFPPLGRLEADITSGGTSTTPWNFLGKLQKYENKTLRYPGHFEWLRAYKALGLFSEEAVQVAGTTIIPRQLYHFLLEPKITASLIRDVCVIRVRGVGIKGSQKTSVSVDLIDYFDEKTGFTAMERLTGWHCAIMMGFQARREVRPGCFSVDSAVLAGDFMAEISKRGIHFDVSWVE